MYRIHVSHSNSVACTFRYMKLHVDSTPNLAKLVAEEEKEENPDPIHCTQTVTRHMNGTPVCPAMRTGAVGQRYIH